MDTEIKSKRGGWGSNFGFLMASIGSAVGLGNIWGFPYKMGKSGGAVFLLLYLVLVVLVGVTVMLGELALGRRSGKSAVSTYRGLSKKYTWLGYAGIVCGFCIMCFYFVLGGIVLRYAVGYFLAIFGGSEFAWSGQGTGFFGYFLTDTNSMILFFVLYILLNILVVSGGVQGGIEKFCNVGMPALFCLLVFIILYIACQPGAAEGYKFMFSPDFSVFSNPEIGFGRVLKNAAGQMFFSLSIGLGVMMTYGSYLGKQEHLQRNALIVCGADTLIAVMAGMAVMPACAAFGVEYGAGPGLLFASMQTVFAHMGSIGNFIGFIFYLLVLIAALTSSISMLELCTAYAVDKQIDQGPHAQARQAHGQRRGARVRGGLARRARRAGRGRCRRRRRRDAGHPVRPECARMERLLARPVRHGRRGHPHAARCARDDNPHRLGAQARGRAARVRAERLEVPRRRLLQALLQVHRAGAARVHPLLPAHRLLRPEDPRPELNPASQKVPSASAPTGGR